MFEDFVVDLAGARQLLVLHLLRQVREDSTVTRIAFGSRFRGEVIELVIVAVIAKARRTKGKFPRCATSSAPVGASRSKAAKNVPSLVKGTLLPSSNSTAVPSGTVPRSHPPWVNCPVRTKSAVRVVATSGAPDGSAGAVAGRASSRLKAAKANPRRAIAQLWPSNRLVATALLA